VSRVPRSRIKCDINVKEVDGVLKTGPWVITPLASSVCAPNRRSAGRQIGGEGWEGENEWKKGGLQEEARELAETQHVREMAAVLVEPVGDSE
jgi:hypothetical protein